jgi:catechol 2,3-dioxygenase-like lactoylglutathione lyase family enzyme
MMSEPILNPQMIVQIGIVVHDIEASARHLCALFGCDMPPIRQTAGHAQAETTFNGQPSEATAKLAFFDAGQLQIELIQPDEQPSTWRNHLDDKGESVHHIAFKVRDTGETVQRLESLGIPMVQQGLFSNRDGVYTYLDSVPQIGVTLELLESFGTVR